MVLGRLGQPEKAIGHESPIELWSPNLTTVLAAFGTDRLRRQEAMKTADIENPNHGVALPRNRAHGTVSQNRSRSIKRAEKQETLQPREMCFFLTSPFIEQSGSHLAWCRRSRCQVRPLLRVAPLPGISPAFFPPAIVSIRRFGYKHLLRSVGTASSIHTGARSALTCCFPKGSVPSFLLETKMAVHR